MSQKKTQLYPKQRSAPEQEGQLPAAKPAGSEQLGEANLDEVLSKDAEDFLRRNKQKGGE